MTRTRFAPTTSGEAHPGTFLSAVLVLLDARLHGLESVLRFEDLDPNRCTPENLERMREDLGWLGLRFDVERVQSESRAAHEQALDALQDMGRLYPCGVSRAQLKASGRRAPDGSFTYDNRSRDRKLPPGGWRACSEPLRVRLSDRVERLQDESGLVLEHPLEVFGDPVVRRRDGAIAYQLASVVDDGVLGVTRIVRGHDLASSTLVQNALRELLELSAPIHRHHFLLLERHDSKLSKMHGAIGASTLRASYSAEELLGLLAYAAELVDRPEPLRLRDIDFQWQRVRREDRIVDVEEGRLLIR